ETIVKTAQEWPTAGWWHAVLLQEKGREKRHDGRPRRRERQHREAQEPALWIGAQGPERGGLWRLQSVRESRHRGLILTSHHPPSQGLHAEEHAEDTVDEAPAADRRDQPGTRADGRRQEQAVEREAHGIQQRVVRWCSPLLEEKRARRGGDQVTEHKEEARQE